MSREIRVLVTGGSGYVGAHVARALASSNFQVFIYDLLPPPSDLLDLRVKYIFGNICDGDQVHQAMASNHIEAVIHTAGFGLGGTANLPAYDEITWAVNVNGTSNVIEACKMATEVKALVFTSSVNISFTKAAKESDESRSDCHKYLYTKSKQMAEDMILRSASDRLKCCSLRLGGVYGPGEQMILPKMYRCVQRGLVTRLDFARDDLKIDFVHVDNVVQAHIKALNQLLNNSEQVNGQYFNITDGRPQSLNFLLDPIKDHLLGPRAKTMRRVLLPSICLSLVANFLVFMSKMFGKKIAMPFWGLTPMEVEKITTSHYYDISKACNLLGYEPIHTEKSHWTRILEVLDQTERMAPRTNQSYWSWLETKNSGLFLSLMETPFLFQRLNAVFALLAALVFMVSTSASTTL